MASEQAPVTREHRRAAAEAFFGDMSLRDRAKQTLEHWYVHGEFPHERGEYLFHETHREQLTRISQAIANEGARVGALVGVELPEEEWLS